MLFGEGSLCVSDRYASGDRHLRNNLNWTFSLKLELARSFPQLLSHTEIQTTILTAQLFKNTVQRHLACSELHFNFYLASFLSFPKSDSSISVISIPEIFTLFLISLTSKEGTDTLHKRRFSTQVELSFSYQPGSVRFCPTLPYPDPSPRTKRSSLGAVDGHLSLGTALKLPTFAMRHNAVSSILQLFCLSTLFLSFCTKTRVLRLLFSPFLEPSLQTIWLRFFTRRVFKQFLAMIHAVPLCKKKTLIS